MMLGTMQHQQRASMNVADGAIKYGRIKSSKFRMAQVPSNTLFSTSEMTSVAENRSFVENKQEKNS